MHFHIFQSILPPVKVEYTSHLLYLAGLKPFAMHTILGAGGVISRELVKALLLQQKPIRLVSRKAVADSNVPEVIAADLLDASQTANAIEGSSVVYLCAGLKYDKKVWASCWPLIMQNVINGCKQYQAKLIFFDNVYMYGKVAGNMTEETPYRPCSKKGEIRAKIATMLMDEVEKGDLTALIARSADFYGPYCYTSVLNSLTFDAFLKNKSASWLMNDKVPHSFTFTPDAGKALSMLAADDSTFNQVWHLPTATLPPTGEEIIQLIASSLDKPDKYSIMGRGMIRFAGLFNKNIREMFEMLYQYEDEYIFDSSKFERYFHFHPTSYEKGVSITADWYKYNNN
jgi:nucleoside-diphosphate-sugar epimerase